MECVGLVVVTNWCLIEKQSEPTSWHPNQGWGEYQIYEYEYK